MSGSLKLLTILAAVSVSACASLPSAGPAAEDVQDEYSSGETRPFELVDISAETVATLKQRSDPGLASQFGDDTTAPQLVVGRGDGLSISLWEAGSDPLFSSNPSMGQQSAASGSARSTTFSEQIVGSDGSITIPFVGRVPVAGLTTIEVQSAVEQALTGKAQKPQVLVTLTRNMVNTVAVIGEAASAPRVPLSSFGERLLDVVAASGVRTPTYETQIQLTRSDSSVTLPLRKILNDPKENILLHPGDRLVITRQPETYTAFGATGRNTQISFESTRVTLVEAIARAGGLLDARADPEGIFLFRFEPRDVAKNLGTMPEQLKDEALVPVVYRLDLTKAGGYFLAQDFELRDRDMLYVSSASANEWQKFLQLIGFATQPILSGVLLQDSLQD